MAEHNTSATWCIENNRVIVRAADVVEYPSASEVVGVEFKGRTQVRSFQVNRPSKDLPNIVFHRFTADLSIRLTPSSADLSVKPSLSIMAKLGGRTEEVGTEALQNDQILLDGGWFPLASARVDEINEILANAGIKSDGNISVNQYFSLTRQGSGLVLLSEVPPNVPFTQEGGPGLPVALKASLYPYQKVGFAWLARVAREGIGCILADEMGLGKTLQVIALIAYETEALRTPALIIAPATLLENWRREFLKFAPSLSVCIHRGATRSGFPKRLIEHDVVVTSYETAVRDLGLLGSIPWNIMVLDEAQAIKNSETQRAKALRQVERRVAVAMSGTPVENTLRDLWSLMDFVVPGYLGSLSDFEARFQDNVADAQCLGSVASPLMLRRRVKEVANDLPEKIEIPQSIELSAACAREYENIRADIAARYGAAATLVALSKLRMYCTHPFLINPSNSDPALASTKYQRLCEIIQEIQAERGKALIFSSYTGMADLLHSDLSQRFGLPCWIIDGRTEVADRQPLVDRFSTLDGSAVLILNPKAAGTGLNITAAHHVIHYNLEWNPATEDQATARAYRRGQQRPVTVHRLFHCGTVEEVIDQRMSHKRDIASGAVVGTTGETDDLADIVRALNISPLQKV